LLMYHSLINYHSGLSPLKLKVELKETVSHHLPSANISTCEACGQPGLVLSSLSNPCSSRPYSPTSNHASTHKDTHMLKDQFFWQPVFHQLQFNTTHTLRYKNEFRCLENGTTRTLQAYVRKR